MSKDNAQAISAASPAVPSLAVAINDAWTIDHNLPDGFDYVSIDWEKELPTMLQSIDFRLHNNLDEAWHSPAGGIEGINPSDIEERWARQITEMLLFTPYNGPGQTYFGSSTHDKDLYDAVKNPVNPCYPIVAACQHLCTMAVLSRGFTLEAKPHCVDADSANNVKATIENVQPPQGKWHADATRQIFLNDKNEVTPTIDETHLTPGSFYSYYNGTETYVDKDGNQKVRRKAGAHVVFVLRINGDKARIQLFDTGAARNQDRTPSQPELPKPKAVARPLLGCGNYDYGWYPQVQGPAPYQGLAVLPKPSKEQLEAAISRMQKSRPLGLARLVIRERQSDSTLFATPMLRMYDAGEKENFSIARYLWSLRKLAHRNKVSATWIIYVPRFKLASAMVEASREVSLGELIERLHPNGVPGNKLTEGNDVLCIEYLSTVPDSQLKNSTEERGDVYVQSLQKSTSSSLPKGDGRANLPWDRASGSVTLKKDDVPKYLQGEWSDNPY